MTGVAALSAVSIPGIAPAMPNTGDGAPGTGSIFDALLAALAPIASDPSGAPAQATPQATPQAVPPAPASASDAASAQTVLPDAVASLEAALAASLPSLLPSEAQSDPLKPDTALPNPNTTDPTGLPPPPDGNLAPLPPRPGRSDQPGPNAPASTATPDASLLALAMIPPQLPPADDVPAAPVNPSADDVTIGSASAKPGGSNPLPVIETNVAPQEDVSNAGAANPPLDSTAQPQPAKSDATAIPAQGAMPLVLPQAGNAAVAALSLKGAPSPTAEKPAANSADRPGQTSTMTRASKATGPNFVTQADDAAPPTSNGDVSAPADRVPSNLGHTQTASHASQDLAANAVPRPDNLTSTVASNGYASQTPANNAPIALAGITAVNAMWANSPQTGNVQMNLVLSPAGVVPDQASVDALALRIAAKSADGESQFQIRLDPPSLGRIEIHLNMDSQGNAQAQLSADRPQTLDALQRDSGALERALKDAGLDLPGGLSFSLKSDGKSAAWRDSQNSARNRAMQIDALDAANSAAAILGLTSTGQAWGAASIGLDIRV
jgi:flagellar hook-length control protein FliK